MSFHTVILSYNHPEITARCLQSVLHVVQPEDVTLFHNGSQLRFIESLRGQFPQVHHLLLEKNRGFAGGANSALAEAFADSEWVLFVTNDCELLTAGDCPSRPGLYAPTIFFRGTNRVDSVMGRFDPALGRLEHIKSREDLRGRFYVPGTSFLLHRDVFAEVGGFDESLFTYWEDVDFSQRVFTAGFPVEHVGNFELLHRVGKTCHKHSYYTSYLFHRNRRLVSRRYCPWYQRPKLEAELAGSWLRHSFSLARKKRWSDLRLLAAGYLSNNREEPRT